MTSNCELCAAIDPSVRDCALSRQLRPGQERVLLSTAHAAAVPTIGAFTAGYLLIVPSRHVSSLGALTRPQLAAVQSLAAVVADRIARVYGASALAFEYGLNAPVRRISHAHLHLLPTSADLAGYLDTRLPGHTVDAMTSLPRDLGTSYIAVQITGGRLRVYPVANDAQPRLRLREIVAALDPQIIGSWDWETEPHPDLMRRTLDDLRSPRVLDSKGSPS